MPKAKKAPKLYLKALKLDKNRHLISAHGGNQVWRLKPDCQTGRKTVTIPPGERSPELCQEGILHGLRLRDLPYWAHTHLAVVETFTDPVLADESKVGMYDQRIIRVSTVDGLDVLVRFAELSAEIAKEISGSSTVTTEEIQARQIAFFLSAYGEDFFEGVER